jgi:xylulokinase
MQVCQVADPVQANARGAAWIAAAGMGDIQFSDIPALVSFQQVFNPNPKNRRIYAEKFEVFKQIYEKMSPVYRRLNGG